MENNKREKTIEAYRRLQPGGGIERLHNIKKKMALHKLTGQAASRFIFGPERGNAEVVARQFLQLRLNTPAFNEKLLHAAAYGTKLSDELLPKEWAALLADEQVPVNAGTTSVRFAFYILKRFAFNCLNAAKLLWKVFFSGKTEAPETYVRFCDITAGCIPWEGPGKKYTVCDWYMQWSGRINNCSVIQHNVATRAAFQYGEYTIESRQQFPGPVTGLLNGLRLKFWFAGSFFISLFSLLAGQWINALLLYEAMLAKIIRMTPKDHLARDYLFSISFFAYRPMWSYAAERAGCLVTNFSYASSFGGFKVRGGYPDIEYQFEDTTWPRLLYWTDDYINFIRPKVKPGVEVIHTGLPVHFSDQEYSFPALPEKTVAVFDVSPADPYVSAKLLPDPQYRNFENGQKFLSDIYEVFGKAGYTIVWKRKRSFSTSHNEAYIRFCDAYEQQPNVMVIPPDVSAFHVAERCEYSISMPFTSTAFIGAYFGKPSLFYDAAQTLYPDDRGAQGILFLQGITELEKWKQSLPGN